MNEPHFLIIDHTPKTFDDLRGENLIIKMDNYLNIKYIYDSYRRNNHVHAIWLYMPMMSLSYLPIDEEWIDIPIIAWIYDLGDMNIIFHEIDILKKMSIRIFLPLSVKENFTSLKLLSSLGIDSGFTYSECKSIDSDKLMDLASYFYMSPYNHASIEPFDYIWRNLNAEQNLNIDTVYFINPKRYIFMDSEHNIAFSGVNLKNGEYIGKFEDFEKIEFVAEYNYKLKNYYSHFDKLDNCSKCPNFKICSRNLQTKLTDCENVIAEIYEYAELRGQIEQKQNQERELICQL